MNGNTAVLPERLLECGMNTVYSGMPFVSGAACANIVSASRAEQSRAEQSRAEQSRAEQSTPQSGAKQCSAARAHRRAVQNSVLLRENTVRRVTHRFRLTFARPVVSSRVHESYYFATPRNEALQLRSGFVFSQQAAQPENDRTDRK